MMFNRIFSALFLALITAIGFFMYQQQDIGYLKLAFADYEIETNLLVVLATSLIALFLAVLMKQMMRKIGSFIAYFGSKRRQRLSDKASHSMVQGLIELAEGRFDKAEKLLLTEIKHNENSLLAYLGAARAAQQQDAHNRRDKYLRLAHETTPAADTAIRLTKAELQLAHKQNEQALATLTMLAEDSPKHVYVLKLLARVYRELEDWHNLKQILPELKKLKVLAPEDTAALETLVWQGLLDEIAISRNVKALMKYWSDLPRTTKHDPSVTAHYAQLLINIEANGEAEQVLRQALSNNWNEELVALYSSIDVLADNKQLETAEGWLQQHQQNAHLLLALGNMCTNKSLWGKARNYYEASISVRALPQNYLRLARLLEEHMGEPEAAQEYYRQGLHLLAGQPGASTERLLKEDNTLGIPVSAKPELKVV